MPSCGTPASTSTRLGAAACAGMLVVLAWAGTAGAEARTATHGPAPTAASAGRIDGSVVDRNGTRDRRDDEPVAEARIVVSTPAGEPVAEARTDARGEFTLTIPETGQFVATLDLESLPDGVGRPDEGHDRVTIDPERARVLHFNLATQPRATTRFVDRLAQRLVDGASFGLLIAMVAVGLSLIFGTTGLVNFSHGELVTFGAVVAWYLNVDAGLWIGVAGLLAVGAGGLAGAVLDGAVWRRLRRRRVSLFAMMVVSIGLAFVFRNLLQFVFGASSRPYANYFAQRASIHLGPVELAPKTAFSMAISLAVLLGVAALLQRTRTGKAMRAVADNPDLAASSGIDVDAVIRTVWVVGGALAALGGTLYALDQQVSYRFGFELLLLMFAGITLGGIGTAFGALVGSFVVGLLITVSTLWVPFELKNVGALAVLVLVLLVRPQGLLGRAERVG